jgi:pimeloyl-ACP methyl ester carboxylesterase
MEILMANKLDIFLTAESKKRYNDAYSQALLLWPIPFKEEYITSRFGDTHLIVSGPKDAAPLILFHPAGCGSVIWYRNIKALSSNFRVYAIDTMGEVNRSIIRQPLQSVQDLLSWIEELFIGLQLDKADLVGNSFGGYICALAAAYMPERVKSIVLISPAATFGQMWPWILHFFPAYMIGTRRIRKWAYDWIWQGYPVDSCIAEMRMIASISGMPKHKGPKVLHDDELRRIRASTLLLIGDHEVIYDSVKIISKAKRVIANLKTEIVPNANHNAEYTASEFVNSKIVSFLAN